MLAVSAREDLVRSPGADATAAAVLDAAGLTAAEIDLFDLYSCFPVAVDVFAEAAGLDADALLTVTGGMAFAGGPYNNYYFQATARAAELLRAGAGRTALLSCVSGILTKQAFALWSTEPPVRGFVRCDMTTPVAATAGQLPVVESYSGSAIIAGCTVVYSRGEPPTAVVLLDTPNGARTLAVSDAADVIAGIECEEWVGRMVDVAAGRFAP
jgi:acetyl-CoA C-acetyltransferase